jgi:hypothetical protein
MKRAWNIGCTPDSAMKVTGSALRQFLIDAKTRLAAADGARDRADQDHAWRSSYVRAPFRYEAQSFGESGTFGQETVWLNETPVWGLSHHGSVDRAWRSHHREILAFLHTALMMPDARCPTRGPRLLRQGPFLYVNNTLGTLLRFVGKEGIYWRDHLVCFQDYLGGTVRWADADDLEIDD